MRNKLLRAYTKAELILHTGSAYQFVINLEKLKYVAYYLPPYNLDDVDAPGSPMTTENTMTSSELDEIIALVQNDQRPFWLGEIVNGEIDLNRCSKYKLFEEVHRYHKKTYSNNQSRMATSVFVPLFG